MTALKIELVPCLKDNYAYLLHDPDANTTAIVDPSEAAPVFAALEKHGLKLTHILNTHHHFDHTGGNVPLKEKTGAIIVGPRADQERIPGIDVALSEGETFEFGTRKARVFDIPAHTKGHIAFWFEADQAVFTGDTMFAMGCGRLFEGTPEQMWKSLSKLVALPDETRVYCGHEYTESNGRFALTVEPDNADIVARMRDVAARRARNEPTIPSTIGLEKKTNPFVRATSPTLQKTLGLAGADPVTVLAETRKRKDSF